MAKKKKSQLKAVARGFATTSVPKKAVQPDVSLVEGESIEHTKDIPESPGEANTPSQVQNSNDDLDADKLEEQSLQNLVDKLHEKTEKEVMRTFKAIEMERRLSKTLPRLEVDSALMNHIMPLAEEGTIFEEYKPIDGSEEKAIARLGVTYGVLRRVGFSEDRVEECLRNITGVDLEEAYDWLYLRCNEEELGEKTVLESAEPKTPKTPRTPVGRRPQTPIILPTVSNAKSHLDGNAPAFVPSHTLQAKTSLIDTVDHAEIKARVLASLDSFDDPELLDTDYPTLQYVRLKLSYDQITSSRHSESSSKQRQALRARLEDIKHHYFFDEKEAEARYRVERERLDAVELQERLRGSPSMPPPHPTVLSEAKSPAPISIPAQDSPNASNTMLDIFEDELDGNSGGLLDLLYIPTTETSSNGVPVSVRDMALPKHWSGRTPKILLQESVSKADRYAAIFYNIISGQSRGKRAAVSIRWDGRKSDDWCMTDFACHDEGQAEQCIATIALHALTFPPTEGFSGSSLSTSGNQTSFRLLPPAFRDLWDELENDRRIRDDAKNRRLWAKLRSIVEPKLEHSMKTNKNLKQIPDKLPAYPTIASFQSRDILSEQIATSFRAKQMNPVYQAMLTKRNLLPIAEYREEIVQILEYSQVLVLSGETGCGKSTQVPTFILEDQLSRGKSCKIFCTEPRRISAVSLAQRVSYELGEAPHIVGTQNSLVGYSIRLESNISRSTRLAFVTNGIALRMLEGGSGQEGQGTAFDDITHIIIDEVHERTIESDFLLIVLKSLLEQRSELKVILMSATVDADKISAFFGNCPTLHIPGRTFPVDIRYLEDAIECTGWSISEGSQYARRLHDKFYKNKNRIDWVEDLGQDEDEDEDMVQKEGVKLEKRYSPETATTLNLYDERVIPYDLIIRLLEKICFEDPMYTPYSAAILIFMPGLGEIRRLNDMLADHASFGSGYDFKVYPLHSTLSSEDQGAVFEIPPQHIRKIVIATNIAETGITIPDITCVIDTGKHREMRFDEKRQLSRLVETFVAKSNAAQRRGRAGRVQRGICFHLFTKIRHDSQMADNPLPEMMRLSLSDLALRIKIMKIKLGSSIEDVLSRALDPPASINVQRAISMLVEVRALSPTEDITPMGRLLSKLPTDVHLGKFLLISTLFRCLDPALTIAAALNSKSPFVTPFGLEQEADRAKNSFKIENSDFLTIHNAFCSWRRASSNPSFVRKFCRVNFLSHQNMQQIEELRQQFLGYLIDSSFIHVDSSFIRDLSRARYGRHRTRFVAIPPELDSNSSNTALINAALVAGLYPKVLAIDISNGQLRTITNNQNASFHPSSVNFGRKLVDFDANHLAYFTLMHSKKMYAWETGPVDDMAMLLLCGESDFKLIANTASVDRKIKFQIPAKANIALKMLRAQIAFLLSQQYKGKPLTESQILWNEVALMVLGKMKFKDEVEKGVLLPKILLHEHNDD